MNGLTFAATTLAGNALRPRCVTRSSERKTLARLMKGNHSRLERHAWCQLDLKALPSELRPSNDETLDLILRNKILLLQARRGYRANTDSQVLAYFALSRLTEAKALEAVQVVSDVGAGNGLVSILLGQSFKARGHASVHLELWEMQPTLTGRAKRNLALNGLEDISRVHECTVANGAIPEQLRDFSDVVLCNPPFYQHRDRTPPTDEEKRKAFFETDATLYDFAVATRATMKSQPDGHGRGFWIFPYELRDRLVVAIENAGMGISNITEVYHDAEADVPVRILIETRPYPTGADPEDATMVLHPNGVQNRYGDHLERHLESLPRPLWRIGRLKDDAVWAAACGD